MIDKQAWVCKINNVEGAGAFYSPTKDEITVPLKKQFKVHDTPEEVFKDGMEYYSSIAHEMAHSTGVEKRLGRDMEGHFGDPKYAKEELVAAANKIIHNTNRTVSEASSKCWAVYINNYIVKACIVADTPNTTYVGQYSAGKITVPDNRPTQSYSSWLPGGSNASLMANLAQRYDTAS